MDDDMGARIKSLDDKSAYKDMMRTGMALGFAAVLSVSPALGGAANAKTPRELNVAETITTTYNKGTPAEREKALEHAKQVMRLIIPNRLAVLYKEQAKVDKDINNHAVKMFENGRIMAERAALLASRRYDEITRTATRMAKIEGNAVIRDMNRASAEAAPRPIIARAPETVWVALVACISGVVALGVGGAAGWFFCSRRKAP
ncbi:MAG: hypothetical protein M1321_02075 [Candidatus Marsarchaeota archaeon]|jgi:hypothetical protein|nr:hypothetical protein [Candidatus Marsarchaeota archaeon]